MCINQEDLQERSIQVMLMNKIYRQAQCTIVWLGEQDEYTSLAVRVLSKIAGFRLAYGSLDLEDKPQANVPEFEGIDTFSGPETIALAFLFIRNWISRI